MDERFPDIVGSEELVARVLFSPSYIHNGRVAPTAFRWEILPSGTVEDYISVLRGDVEGQERSTRLFKARTEGDERYGYVRLCVGEIRMIDDSLGHRVKMDVLAYPSRRMACHAGIVAEIEDEWVTARTPITPEVMMLQKKLTMLCSDIVKF